MPVIECRLGIGCLMFLTLELDMETNCNNLEAALDGPFPPVLP